VQALVDGRVAIMVTGQWALQAGAERDAKLGVAAVPPPAAFPGRAGATLVDGPVLVLPAGAADQATAADLLAWMLSPPVAAQVALDRASLPATRIAAADPRVRRLPGAALWLDLLAHPNAGQVSAGPGGPEMSRALGKVEEQVLHEGGDPRALLRALQAELAPERVQAASDRGAP
jgi:ABC-type glycerol-3-phosphate transport system substrate-binding protein